MSRDLFNQLIKQYRPHLSVSSLVQYTNVLINIFKDVTTKDELLKAIEKENLDKILKSINELHSSPSSKCFKYNALISIFKGLIGEDDPRFILVSKLRDQCNKSYIENLSNPVASGTIISNDEYKSMIDKWRPAIEKLLQAESHTKSEFFDIQSYFIALIYYHNAFRSDISPMDIIFTKVLPEDTTKNYIHVFNRKMSFVMRAYKTASTYGEKVIPITDKEFIKELNSYIAFLVKYNNRRNNLRFFSNKSNSGYLDTNNLSTLYSNIFKSMIGKAFSITQNRKRMVSDNVDVAEYVEAKKKVENLADGMMNSVATQQAVYNVNTKKGKNKKE
jgi:hypothetical protein